MTGEQIIALVSVLTSGAVGAAGLWQAHRARNQPLRDAVYTMQLQVLRELARIGTPYVLAVGTIARPDTARSNNQDQATAEKLMFEFESALTEAQIFLPRRTVEALLHLQESLVDVVQNLNPVTAEQGLRIGEAIEGCIRVAREELGINALGDEALKGIGGRASTPLLASKA